MSSTNPDSNSNNNNKDGKDSDHLYNENNKDYGKRDKEENTRPKGFVDRSRKDDDINKPNKKSEVIESRPVDPRFKRLLWYLISSTRGGVNRAKIIDFISDNPSNANQLSNQLKLDYKTIIHHLDVLKKNGLIITENEESYGATYFISPITEKNYSAFVEIMDKIGKK